MSDVLTGRKGRHKNGSKSTRESQGEPVTGEKKERIKDTRGKDEEIKGSKSRRTKKVAPERFFRYRKAIGGHRKQKRVQERDKRLREN